MLADKEAYKQFDVSLLIHSTPSPPPRLSTDTMAADSKSEGCAKQDFRQKPTDDTYNLEQYFNLIQALLLRKLGNFSTIHSLLRTCLDLSLAHLLQMKGSQRRDLSLKSLSVCVAYYKNTTFQIIALDSINAKPLCKKVYGFIRHFKTELCLQFSLSLYLFVRFHVPDGDGKIDLCTDLLNDAHFLKAKLMNGGQKFRALSYSQQYKAWSKVLRDMGDFAPSILSRIVASKQNDNPALGYVGTRRFLHKSLSLPIKNGDLDLICQQAGFESASSYHLPRAEVEPPLEIVRQIFPFVDPQATAIRNPLFEVLHMLRISLVQDMVDMKASHPKDFISLHPLFESRAFYEYFCLVRKEIFIPPLIVSNENTNEGAANEGAANDEKTSKERVAINEIASSNEGFANEQIANNDTSYWDSRRQMGYAYLPKHVTRKNAERGNQSSPANQQLLFDAKPNSGQDPGEGPASAAAQECMQAIREPMDTRLERLENTIEDILQAIRALEVKVSSLYAVQDEEMRHPSSDNTSDSM